jgi:acetyl esterase/lipase
MWRAQPYLDAGFTLFAINHRALPGFRYPAPLEDAQRAVRFVRYHAQRFGVDPALIAAWGSSSGGHLASMLGTLDGTGDSSSPDPIDQRSAKVRAVIAQRASYDFTTSSAWRPELVQVVASLLGASFEDAPALYAEASPQTHLSPDDGSFLIVHGDADETIPFSQAGAMRDALEAAGVEHETVRVPGAGHGWSPLAYDETRSVAWLTEQLFGTERASALAPLFAAHRELVERWAALDGTDIDGALALLDQSDSGPANPTVPGWYWNRVCWSGATHGRAAEVIEACDRAVAAVPDEPEYHDSRGLARALTGNYEGAIADFEFFLDHILNEERLELRRSWVEALRAGRNPFTPDVPRQLQSGA